MHYHPLMGIIIFFSAIIFSFLLGKFAYKKYVNRDLTENLKPIIVPKISVLLKEKLRLLMLLG